jgi:hypothetical protein
MTDRLFTFVLRYRVGDTLYHEEIDVTAPNSRVARQKAEELAEADYEPSWIDMIEVQAGGSAGLVQFFN